MASIDTVPHGAMRHFALRWPLAMRVLFPALLAVPFLAFGCSNSSKSSTSLASIPDPVGNYTPLAPSEGDPLPEGDPYDPFPDAGLEEDAGTLDATTPVDAASPVDAGPRVDSGIVDAGLRDSGVVARDAGPVVGPDCANGSGYYCGGNGVAGDANTLFYCYKTGKVVVAEKCAVRCVRSVNDVDDYCAAN